MTPGWLKSYLVDRYLQVKIDGHLSEEYRVKSGVPQGSHLGPVVFNIFINNLGRDFLSNYLLYADDLELYRSISSDDDILALQQGISVLGDWCQLNNLDLNIKKCAAISFNRSNQSIPTDYRLNDAKILNWHRRM